ncbi:uncharacterized protein COLE_04649 [Cutaneotrichosporon oleaginosum]|uniref:uncharacterized protein n=1 Tax=Cutaneotrichosporon oleaginosum TaxID=879819 RepID=UPI001326BB4C|nr:hypothetical protein COLE_04649 [Cutaneotrichosporon oleaginosum]
MVVYNPQPGTYISRRGKRGLPISLHAMKYDENGNRLITGYVPQLALTGVVRLPYVPVGRADTVFARTKPRPKYMLWITIGTFTMAVGFGARIPMTNDPGSLGIYVVTTLFTLLSPCAFLAQDYVLLPRLASWLDAEDCLFLSARLVARIFIGSDICTFLIQAAGGGMTAIESMASIGEKCISFGLFWILLVVFAFRLYSSYAPELTPGAATTPRSGRAEVGSKAGRRSTGPSSGRVSASWCDAFSVSSSSPKDTGDIYATLSGATIRWTRCHSSWPSSSGLSCGRPPYWLRARSGPSPALSTASQISTAHPRSRQSPQKARTPRPEAGAVCITTVVDSQAIRQKDKHIHPAEHTLIRCDALSTQVCACGGRAQT